MSRVFFRREVETVASFWRIFRRDGVALGFTAHDRDLWFDGLLHRAAPGLLPSAIRRTADLEPDSAEIQGALTHDAISAEDLAAGRFDAARLEAGVVDWETLERALIYSGEIGAVSREANGFEAELRSAKTMLEVDLAPRTGPTCRAEFCGPGCSLSAARHTHEATVATVDRAANRVNFTGGPPASAMADGSLRWVDGPQAGEEASVVEAGAAGLVIDLPIAAGTASGMRALFREGCDHTLAACHGRFANSVNFRAEPFLPGNDLMARYPVASA